MKLVTVDTLQGCNYEEIGIVSGSTIQAKNMFADLGQQLKGIVGGELGSYTGMMEKAREIATQRMVNNAVLVYNFEEGTILYYKDFNIILK